jgi:hypothetical protein
VLDLETRTAILRLRREGHGTRKIAQALGVARRSVARVIAGGGCEVPSLERAGRLDSQLEHIRALYVTCRGNLVRVWEELGVDVSYPTLTRFCRTHGIGTEPPQRVGRYEFGPAVEMQHDTSPHRVTVGGTERLLVCASLVFCYSHVRYAQCYPRFTRFQARLFLTKALRWFGGSASRCMLDNSTVIMVGTGRNAVAVPEMKAFSDRFGFTFIAHEVGDKDRSAFVERPFHHIENSFYPGRTFASLADLNTRLEAWCDTYAHTFNRNFRAVPFELLAAERPLLNALPLHVPEVYDLHERCVDVEGYITLHTNRYSMPEALIGRKVQVHEHAEYLRVFDGHALVVEHTKVDEGLGIRSTLPDHRRRPRHREAPPSSEELALRVASPELAALVDALRARHGGQALKAVRRLHRIWRDYPDEALRPAIARALAFGQFDLDRIERLVLQHVSGTFFRLPTPNEDDNDG